MTEYLLSAFEKDCGEAGEGALSCHYFVEFPPNCRTRILFRNSQRLRWPAKGRSHFVPYPQRIFRQPWRLAIHHAVRLPISLSIVDTVSAELEPVKPVLRTPACEATVGTPENVVDADKVRAAIENIDRDFGSIDVLVSDAGIFDGLAGIQETTCEVWAGSLPLTPPARST